MPNEVARNSLGQILPGQPPLNPTGRPKSKPFVDALLKTLSTAIVDGKPNLERLEAVAEALIVAAKAGDVSAIKEIGDRLDGKVVQTLGQSEDHEQLFPPSVSLVVIDAAVLRNPDTTSLLTAERSEEV